MQCQMRSLMDAAYVNAALMVVNSTALLRLWMTCRQKQKSLLDGVVAQREALQQRLYQAEVQVRMTMVFTMCMTGCATAVVPMIAFSSFSVQFRFSPQRHANGILLMLVCW